MTSSSVSVQGLTYQITCVSLENCLTSGVHLNPSATQGSPKRRIGQVLCLQQQLKNGGRGRKRSVDRVIARDRVIRRSRTYH
jgi:hypothetical protein